MVVNKSRHNAGGATPPAKRRWQRLKRLPFFLRAVR
jgi:hypothetical protein